LEPTIWSEMCFSISRVAMLW